MAKETIYLASKPRYEILDGLRGVAALMVIIFHCFETYNPVFGTQIVNHGYLAVDFFFVLSGFVIGYAYDDRWDKMTTWGFFKRRLTRLHPMVIAGTLIGAALFFFAGAAFPETLKVPGWKFALCLVMGLLILPCPNSLDIRGWGELNSFNGPQWSLTFEYIGNILYAFVFRHLPRIALAILCVVCAFFTLDLTLGWDVFGFFPDGPQYTVIGGWSLTGQQMYIGFTRLLYPFLCGLLISRILPGRRTESNPSGSPIHLKGGFWWCSLALVVLFSIPCIGGKTGISDGIYQAVCILLVFPLIVMAGSGSVTTDKKSAAVCKWLGDLSYPLYITHYPLMYMQMGWVAEHPDAPVWIHIAVNLGVVFMSIILAWGVLKIYDEPVREWLKDHWLKRGTRRVV
ncbi:MAG: acyltransferase [Bacteroidales bacterium]|nr:acyltransferase [Bacteroidales bacterium]